MSYWCDITVSVRGLAQSEPDRSLRTAMLALRTAQAMGLPEDDQVTVFYTGVLHVAGCTAESEIDARFVGDELAARPQILDTGPPHRTEDTIDCRKFASQRPAAQARTLSIAGPAGLEDAVTLVRAMLRDATS